MEQVSPIGILPQASYIDYIPTVEKELDYKTLFSVEQQRVNAAYKKKQDSISNRIKLQGNLDKTLYDPNSPLSMVGDNEEHRIILDGIRSGVQPIINEIIALQSNPNLDENAVLNLESKLTQQLYNNTGFRKVIQDKVKWSKAEQLFPKLDPDAVDALKSSYLNYNGEGVSPLDTFNPAAMMPWDENKYNNQLKGIYTDEADAIINLPNSDGEYRGTILKDTASIDAELDRVWGLNQKALTKQGVDYDSWKTSKRNDYYRGALKDVAGNLVRVTASPTAASMKDSNGSDSKSTKDKEDKPGPVQNIWENVVVPSVPGAPIDGRFSGQQSQDLNPGLNLPQRSVLLNDQIKVSDTEYRELVKQKNAATANKNWTEERRLAELIKTKGADIRQLKGLREEIKSDSYYTSEDYKTSHRELLNSLSDYNFDPQLQGGSFIDRTARTTKVREALDTALSSVKGQEEFFNKLDNLEKEYRSKPKSEFNSDMLTTISAARLQAQNRAAIEYEKYAAKNQIENSQAPSSSWTFDSGDKDYKELINKKYEGKTTNQLLQNSKDVRHLNGEKLTGDNDKIVVIDRAIYDAKTGKYALLASVGDPVQKKSGDVTVNVSDEVTKKPEMTGEIKQVIVQDENVNNKLFHTFFGELGDNGVNQAKEIYQGLTKTLDINDKLSYKKNISGNKVEITKANGGYSVFVNGQVQKDNSGNILVLSRENVTKYVLANPNINTNQSTTNTTNTSGGGNVGKSQKSDVMSYMAEQSETKGSKDPYKEITTSSTKAFGKYQLVPSQQGTRILDFVTKNVERFGITSDKYNDSDVDALRKKMGKSSDMKGYSDEELAAYVVMMDNPKLQDAYAKEVLYEKDYKPNVNKVISAYAKNGKNINEAQAIDLMHHYGVGGALKADKNPRAWAANYVGENKKETEDVNNRIKNYNFTFQSGQSIKGVNSSLIDSTKHLIVKSGLDSLGPQFSSGHRKGGGKSDHDHGNAVDFKFKSESQELEAINKIAALTGNPTETRNMLLKGKGTNGYNIPPVLIKIKDTGKTLKIIYHGDSDGHGNHLHISSN